MKPWHIVVVLIVVLLLFGAPRLPELARSIGKSLNILKEETQQLRGDEPAADDKKDSSGSSDSSRGDARGE